MSAEPQIAFGFSRGAGTAEALYFASGGQTLFAWLHRPVAEKFADFGMVICKPFGYEAICSHRSLRAFAEAGAALGVPTLRLDYLGTGDSEDIDPKADQLEIWVQNVLAAVAELQRRTGVARVCLFGLRLGGLLATLAANRCEAVTSLILVAPIVSGRKYLREIRTTRLAASLGADPAEAALEKTGSIEVSGFFFSEATLASLAKVDLKAQGTPAVFEVLVIDGDNFPASRTWAEGLAASGLPTTYKTLPGMVEMVMTAPQFAGIPFAMVEAVHDWLLQCPLASHDKRGRTVSRPQESGMVPAVPIMSLPPGSAGEQTQITERPVIFGSETELFGILTEPHGGELRRRAVILLNAGADYHIGASGMSVGLARAWARHGYIVLRMDFAGIGDSGTRPGRPPNEIFPAAAVDDIRFAIEFVQSRFAVRDVSVAGLCSGAYHALRAAVVGLPVDRLLMVNPQNYFWKEGMSIYDMQLAELVTKPDISPQQIFSWERWRRLFTGGIDIRYILKRYVHMLGLTLESGVRDIARSMRIRLPHDLGWELEEIASRGVRMAFIFSRGEPGIELLRIQGGSSVKRLGDRCKVYIIDGADHVFSKLGPRSVLERILSDELFARVNRQIDKDSEGEWHDPVRLP